MLYMVPSVRVDTTQTPPEISSPWSTGGGWLLDKSLPSPPVASLLNKATFPFLLTLVCRVLVFKQWAAKPEFSNRAMKRLKGFPGGSGVKNLSANSGNTGLIFGLGRCPGGGKGNRFQSSCLGHSMDREASWGHVESQKSQTWLSN